MSPDRRGPLFLPKIMKAHKGSSVVCSTLVIRCSLQIFKQERLQQVGTGEVGSYYGEQPPSLLTAVQLAALVVGCLFHYLTVNLILKIKFTTSTQ